MVGRDGGSFWIVKRMPLSITQTSQNENHVVEPISL